jgi:hypothetical protein
MWQRFSQDLRASVRNTKAARREACFPECDENAERRTVASCLRQAEQINGCERQTAIFFLITVFGFFRLACSRFAATSSQSLRKYCEAVGIQISVGRSSSSSGEKPGGFEGKIWISKAHIGREKKALAAN